MSGQTRLDRRLQSLGPHSKILADWAKLWQNRPNKLGVAYVVLPESLVGPCRGCHILPLCLCNILQGASGLFRTSSD